MYRFAIGRGKGRRFHLLNSMVRLSLFGVEGSMRPHANRLLAQMDVAAFEDVSRHRAVVELSVGDIIAETRGGIDKVIFPHAGIISCVVALAGGGVIETAMIGSDGVFGAALSMGRNRSLNAASVQIGGAATVIDARVFAELADRHVALRRQVLAYEQFHLSEVQQTAACNAVHTVLARTCRWMLRMHDLVGRDIAITQEALSHMMGVRRTSITAAVQALQTEGAVNAMRGRIRIVDLAKLSDYACECHAELQHNYGQLR